MIDLVKLFQSRGKEGLIWQEKWEQGTGIPRTTMEGYIDIFKLGQEEYTALMAVYRAVA